MRDYNLEKRKFVIAGVAIAIVFGYILRLFTLQIMSDDYKKNAASNAFLNKVQYPARGAIYDREGRLMVYNQPAYDVMVVMREAFGHLGLLPDTGHHERIFHQAHGRHQEPGVEPRIFPLYGAGVHEPASG